MIIPGCVIHSVALAFFSKKSGFGWCSCTNHIFSTELLNHCEEHAAESIRCTLKTISQTESS